jgi:hypothetical protein
MERIATACNGELASLDGEGIRSRLQESAPELRLRYAMARSGWHRLGGVVDADYRPLARHIDKWVERESAGDLEKLMDKCSKIGGFVTRLEGCTHYLTAVSGERARDYIQIEVEQLQEVIERPLWDPDWMPDDLEDFIDPMGFPHLDPEPVAPPRLVFRRLLYVADFVESEDVSKNTKRFMDDWDRSSAGESADFCDHWILSVREYTDTYGDGRLSAKPVPLPGTAEKELPDEVIARGAALANLIHGFDRDTGYHFAWYFHMLARRQVSHRLAEAVHADLMGAFDYLPARDIAVLRDWYDAPYGV